MRQEIKHISLTSLLQVICLLVFFLAIASLTQAQISGPKYSMDYDQGLLTLSAEQASLKKLLRGLADTLNIYIRYPRDLNKQITIKLHDAPLIKALQRILKDQDYAIVYSASRSDGASAISELYILPKPIGHGTAVKNQRRSPEERTLARIRGYERTIERLKDRLARTNDERTERRIIKQISSQERIVERLQKQLGR